MSRGDRGSVTAEFAIALPALMVVLACCLAGLQVAGTQLRLQDAAAAAARSLARGEPASIAARLMPGAAVSRHSEGDLVCATLSAQASGLIPLALQATSCALGGGR
jgi:hypothetical protein